MNKQMPASTSSITGIIVAAGFSFRMKTLKQVLPLKGQPAIVQAVKSLQAGGIHDIRVVVGHRSEQMIPLLQNLKVTIIVNEHYAEGMFTSVQAGVANLPPQTSGFFLLPADTPIISAETFRCLIDTFMTRPGIVYPGYRGERGHPPVINARYIPDILNWQEEGGLRAVLNRFENDAIDVPVDDPGILLDMDTPIDYLKLCAYCRVDRIPSVEECEILLNLANAPLTVRNHSRAVAAVACELGRQLIAVGCRLNLSIIHAAGLLHDIAKGKHDHAIQGANVLADYPEVAEIVAAHTDIVVSPEEHPSEQEIIYLADKLVKEDQLTGLQSRFAFALEKYKDNLQIRQKVLKRLENAQLIKEKIEVLLNSPLENIWPEHLRGKENG